MTILDVENRLKRAATVAAPSHSIVDDVMRRLPTTPRRPAPQSFWRRPIFAGFSVLAGCAALILVFLFFSPAVRLTLADVQTAFERQHWIHAHYDVGQIKDTWTHLQTGEAFASRYDGNCVYTNDRSNTCLWYWKNSGVIDQGAAINAPPGQAPPPWTAHTAWENVVAPFEHAAAGSVFSAPDTLGGVPVIRFDDYGVDALGQRFLYVQLWADPRTHLPVRIKTRLQLGERIEAGKDWSTGDYDFPATGPSDLYALGVPRDIPIVKEAVASADVQPILDAINHHYDNFLKNYRAIIIATAVPPGISPVDQLDVVWRNGEKVRQDHHLPELELQANPNPPLPKITAVALLAWASRHEPMEKLLMDSRHEYSWASAATAGTAMPRVQVTRHHEFPLLATGAWPETIQWPTRYNAPGFTLLGTTADTPPGCIGLRSGGQGNSRTDYYVDPKNDYVCVTGIQWAKRGADWTKTRDCALSDLHRIAGRAVAGSQWIRDYGDPARKLIAHTEHVTIDVVPLTPADYPPGTFDPASLTTGAKVEGY